ncbi:MAG: hypothetical protein JO293_07380, partial [Candidatus Eremiobacteraeota bacterium]|nr:hypothetical protein [Candidatus Eremiobacteraeota bacterium]
MAAALLQRNEKRKAQFLREAAAAWERDGRLDRSAELYLAAGDQESAARAINSLSWLDNPAVSIRLARVIGSLERDVIMRYPQIWGIAIAYSRFSIDPVTAISEARLLLQRAGDDLPLDKRVHVVRPLAGYLSRLGLHEEGYTLISNFEKAVDVPQIPRSINEAGILYIRMMIAARLGKIEESRALAERSWPFAMRHDSMAALFLIEQAAEVLRALGDREHERKAL